MIIVRLKGGLGNQMFQYALGRALSLKYNVSLKLDVTFLNHRIKVPYFLRPNFNFRSFDLDVFNIKAEIAKPADITLWNRPFFSGQLMLIIDAVLRKLAFLPGWEKSFNFDEKVFLLGPNAYLEGFWQSEKYFSEITSVIRDDFTLKEELSKESLKLAEEIKNTASLCIHLRKKHGGKLFHETYDLDYYKEGIDYINKNRKIEKIYIFSDDIEWCKQNIKFSYPTMFVDSEYAGKKGEGHLYLMSICKHFVIPNSTFSWWGAWLSNNPEKIVVAPRDWFVDVAISTVDLIPKNWVRI